MAVLKLITADADTSQLSLYTTVFESSSGTVTNSTEQARTGSRSMKYSKTASSVGLAYHTLTLDQIITGTDGVNLGFGLYIDTSVVNLDPGLNIGTCAAFLGIAGSDGYNHVILGVNAGGVLEYRTNTYATNSSYQAAGSTPVPTDEWVYISIFCKIDLSVGVMQIKMNGVTEINFTGNTGDDGKFGATTQDIHAFTFGISAFGVTAGEMDRGEFFIDDLVIYDTTGSISNGHPNNVKLFTSTADGDGNYAAQFTSTGANQYQEIDDATPDGDATNISSSTSGHRATVTVTNTSSTGLVSGVSLLTNAKGNGSDTLQPSVRLSSTDYDQTAYTPGTDYAWHQTPITLNPATAARWATAAVDGIEIGWTIP